MTNAPRATTKSIAMLVVGLTCLAGPANAANFTKLEFNKGTVSRIRDIPYTASSMTDFGPVSAQLVVLIDGHPACLLDGAKRPALDQPNGGPRAPGWPGRNRSSICGASHD